ncbi:MAG: alpha/beta fold hydrolase [Solirubrobacteraceae bacterium]
MATVDIEAGPIHYENAGPPDGRPAVFVHGYAMGSSLWRGLTQRLGASGLRCIAPTWPLGAHPAAMHRDADLTMEGIAAIVAAVLAALDLEDVVLIGNDTGGAIAQLVAVRHPGRLGALVLTSCDAFEHFPPPILKPLILAAARPLSFRAALQPLRTRLGRRLAYGALAHREIDELAREWTRPALSDSRVADDLRRFTASLHRRTTLDAAARLPDFGKPALVAWSADDAFFPIGDAHRLGAALGDARVEIIEAARTFSMLDQPDALAALIADFAGPGTSSARDLDAQTTV